MIQRAGEPPNTEK